MTPRNTLRNFTLALLGASLLAAGLPQQSEARWGAKAQSAQQDQAGLKLDLKQGQVLDIVMPKRRLGREGREARKIFRKVALPRLENAAYDFAGRLSVEETIMGDARASAVEFHSYDGAGRKRQLERTRGWAELQAFRSEGWKRQDVFTVELDQDLSLTFDPAKHYTLAIAWTNPANPEDYDRYLDGVESAFADVGARFMHRFRDIGYDSSAGKDVVPPAQIVFVEWEDEEGLGKLLGSEAYKAHSSNFRSGVSDFRFYRLSSPTTRLPF